MNRPSPRRLTGLIVGAAVLLAFLFAAYTHHVWEDYYITYRSSKNLATGYGLVFNHGDRLHTFTSPLGVLLPAAASLLTGNTSDTGALWIFRTMCALALGGGIALLVALNRRLNYPAIATAFLATYLITDAKVLDFTINGMETAFMVLFLAYALWAHFSPGARQWTHLGAAWAGLMWTRPDSFIYIGLVAAALWVFNDPERTGGSRRQLLGLYLRAGLCTTALYGPWLLWAKWYYGSIVPHTIVAKGGQSGGWEAGARFLANFWRMPWLIWQGKASAEGAFLPSYYMFPTWPSWMLPWGRALATICSLLWLVPRVRLETRVASLAFFGGAAYLSYVPYFPFPWYFPSAFLLAAVALTGVLGQLWSRGRPFGRGLAAVVGVIALAGSFILTCGTARQMRAQQALIETGNRRSIGEWLKAHAGPNDSVFLEPLGYIGFFSGLKTYDWPGMSSRELVEAKLLVGTNWGALIRYLQPTWLVLRPDGEGDLPAISPELSTHNYELVREFNRLDDVKRLQIPGRKLLEFDARFRVYHLKNPMRFDADGLEIDSAFGSSIRNIGAVRVRMVHAPSAMLIDVPAGVHHVSGRFGYPPESFTGDDPTDGATFRICWTDGTRRIELASRHLDPAGTPADRALQTYDLTLPPALPGRRIRLSFETDPTGTSTKDWTCWTSPEFRP